MKEMRERNRLEMPFSFKGNSFSAALEKTRREFLLPSELPYMDTDGGLVPADFADSTDSLDSSDAGGAADSALNALAFEIGSIPGPLLEGYALCLGQGELLAALRLLARGAGPELEERLAYILEARMSASLFEYYWAMLQFHHRKEAFLKLLAPASAYMEGRFPGINADGVLPEKHPDGSLPENPDGGSPGSLSGGSAGSLAGRLMDILSEEGTVLQGFCEKYGLIADSPLALDVYGLFFQGCEAGDYAVNSREFLLLLSMLSMEECAAFVNRYLEKLYPKEYVDCVNEAIALVYGLRDEGVFLQEGLSEAAVKKLLGWQNLKKMERHFGSGSSKFPIWDRYSDHIQNVLEDRESGMLFMDFGRFFVVDCRDMQDASYLYEKAVFLREYDEYISRRELGDPVSDFVKVNFIWAKDMLLKELHSEVLEFCYENAGKLYIREIMDLKLGTGSGR